MVKPARLGSSVGMSLVHDASQLGDALDTAFRYDDLALVEAYLPGARDLEVSVIGNDPAHLEIFGPGEIVSGHEFYDYAAKYTPGLSETSTRAEVSAADRAHLHKLARDVYRAVGAEGFARIDFLVAGDRIVVSEINTIPGSPRSASSRRCLPRAATRSATSAAASSTSPSSDTPRATGPGSHRATCRGDAVTGRPTPRRPPANRTTRRAMPGAPVRRSRPVRRASAGLSPVRAGAMLVMLLAAAAIYGVANSTAFSYEHLRIDGAKVTDTTAIEAALADVRGQNLFTLETRPLRSAVADLPTVRAASVSVRLPDTLVVRLDEREAILIWRVGARRYLVDTDGNLFGMLGDDTSSSAAALPVVEDRRAASAGLSIGGHLDPVDLDAATRLASITPTQVASAASRLDVQVTDQSGFVIRSPSGWSAVFGFYTPTLRTPELIPGQVRLLRSLLVGREAGVDRVILASDTDGTYIPRPTPTPAPTSSATPSPSPS